jgi:hypothetical protein
MSNNYQDVEEINGEQDYNVDFNPFDEAVNEKPYTKPNVVFDQKEMMTDIPEPSFVPPVMGSDASENSGTSTAMGSSSAPKRESAPKKEPAPPVNPKYDEMSKKEQKASSLHLAKTIVGGYEYLCSAANKKLLFSEKKMIKLAQEGEVDFALQIPYDLHGNTMSLGEFVNEYNDQQKDSLVVSEEFKEEAVPLLAKVLDKKGMGLTDEQRLLLLFGGDAGQKVIVAMTAISTMKQMVDTFKEITISTRVVEEPNSYSPTPNMNDYKQTTKYEPANNNVAQPEEEINNQRYYEEPDEVNSESINDDIIYDLADEVESQITANTTQSEPKESYMKIIKKPSQKKGLGKRGAPTKK